MADSMQMMVQECCGNLQNRENESVCIATTGTSETMKYLCLLSETKVESKSDENFVRDLCSAIYSSMDTGSNEVRNLEELEAECILDECMKIFGNFQNNQDAVNVSLYVMTSVVSGRQNAAAKLGSMNVIPMIIEAISRMENDLDCLSNGFFLLAALTQNVCNHSRMIECKAFEVVLGNLHAHEFDRDVVCACCAFIANSGCEVGPNRDSVLKFGGLQGTLLAMEHYKDDVAINTWCAKILCDLSSHSLNVQQLVGAHGGIRTIVEMLILFRDAVSLQTYGYGAIRNMIRENTWNAKEFFSLRGMEVCIQAMRVHRNAKELQIYCIDILSSVAQLSQPCLRRVVGDGCINVTLSSMISLKSCRDLQERAFAFMYVLAKANEQVKQKIVDAHGIDIMLRILKCHISDIKLVDDGVKTITCVKSIMQHTYLCRYDTIAME